MVHAKKHTPKTIFRKKVLGTPLESRQLSWISTLTKGTSFQITNTTLSEFPICNHCKRQNHEDKLILCRFFSVFFAFSAVNLFSLLTDLSTDRCKRLAFPWRRGTVKIEQPDAIAFIEKLQVLRLL
jgi:hypothetical protein